MEIVIALGLDLCVILILIIAISVGARRGLVKSIIGLVGNIVALIIALIFSVQLGSYINDHYVRTPLRNWTVNQLTSDPENYKTELSDVNFDELFNNQPKFFTDLCSYMNIDLNELSQKYNEFIVNGEEQAKSAVVDIMVEPISQSVSRVIAFAIIYILALIAVKILCYISNFISKIPVIRRFDRLGGGMIGIVIGILITFIFISMVHLGSPYVLRNKTISERTQIFEKTVVYKRVYKINPLNMTFGDKFSKIDT